MLTRTAIVASCLGFVVIGALQALYGPAIPALQKDFAISPAAAGSSLSAHFAGALSGVILYHLLRTRLKDRLLLAGSYVLMAAGAVFFAIAPTWPLALAAAAVIGVGFGGIDYGLNQLFSLSFGDRSPAMLNILNAHFGIGSIVTPVLIGHIGAEHYPWIFAALGLISLTLILTLRGVGTHALITTSKEATTTSAVRVVPIISAFIGLYVLHVAIEVGVGGWEPTHLQLVGYGAATAATATSAFWLAMTLGRFAVVPLTLRWRAESIITACCLGMTAFLALATIPALAPYAYLGVGLTIAPIFPTCLPWLIRTCPQLTAAGAYVIAASMIGGVAFPPLLGSAIDLTGAKSVPLILSGLAAICAVLSLWLRKNAPDPPAPTLLSAHSGHPHTNA